MEPQRRQGLLVLARTCGTHTLWAVHRPSFTAPSYKIIKSQPLGLSLLSVGGLSVVRVSVVRAHPSEIKDFSAIFAMFADAFVCPPLNLKLLLFIHRHSNCLALFCFFFCCAEINCKLIALIRDRLSSGSLAILLPANYFWKDHKERWGLQRRVRHTLRSSNVRTWYYRAAKMADLC